MVAMLKINADDWGLDADTTDRILNCFLQKRLHTGSAMTFMCDSGRAAKLARDNDFPVGLHLNLTQPFTGRGVNEKLKEHHEIVTLYLNRKKRNQVLYNPRIRKSFAYVFSSQWDEYCRLYGDQPIHVDGHHHMHLCMNMVFSKSIPKGIKVRRNFTFRSGEKNFFNRFYRKLIDFVITRKFMHTDQFHSVVPMERERLNKIIDTAQKMDVELMVHPGLESEYRFLMSQTWAQLVRGFIK